MRGAAAFLVVVATIVGELRDLVGWARRTTWMATTTRVGRRWRARKDVVSKAALDAWGSLLGCLGQPVKALEVINSLLEGGCGEVLNVKRKWGRRSCLAAGGDGICEPPAGRRELQNTRLWPPSFLWPNRPVASNPSHRHACIVPLHLLLEWLCMHTTKDSCMHSKNGWKSGKWLYGAVLGVISVTQLVSSSHVQA